MGNFEIGKNFVEEMDAEDPLTSYREKFLIPKKPTGETAIYFLGNSLGLQAKVTRKFIESIMTSWEEWGVEAYFYGDDPWLHYPESTLDNLAYIVGANPSEITIMNSLTVNLHLMFISFYRPTPKRYKILVEEKVFPSDQYAISSQMQLHHVNPTNALLELKPRNDETYIRTEDIVDLIEREGDSIALIWLGGVNYYSGQAFDLEHITKVGHEKGCIVGYDLAHSVGNVILKLHEWNVDFAVWCNYKYLNGGPGSPGGCFVHERHNEMREIPRLEGWWGNKLDTRFLMRPNIDPMEGAGGWQVSTPSMLGLAPLKGSLEIFKEVGMEKLRKKSVLLTGYLEFLINQIPSNQFSLITPKDPNQRGCQLSIRTHFNGKQLFDHLTKAGIFCDWREPDVIRVAPVPLYNNFNEVYQFGEIMRRKGKRS
ncbi:MAG: kynureninase [Candidatus Hodarchaeota archaeon]